MNRLPNVLSTNHVLSLGGVGFRSTFASAVWPTTNLALFVPFRVAFPDTIDRLYVMNGSAVSGNFIIGLFDERGALLSGSASTGQAGTSVPQAVNITDYRVDSGIFFIGLAFDNTTAQVLRTTFGNALFVVPTGMKQQALGSLAFSNPATFARPSNYVPMCGALGRSAVLA